MEKGFRKKPLYNNSYDVKSINKRLIYIKTLLNCVNKTRNFKVNHHHHHEGQ